jgi:hypothetical protein
MTRIKQENAVPAAPHFTSKNNYSVNDVNVLRLGAFLTLDDFELHSLTFPEGSKTLGVDRRKVNEDIFFAAVTGNEAIAFFAIEPLDNAKFSFCHAWKPPLCHIPTEPANVRSKQEQNEFASL